MKYKKLLIITLIFPLYFSPFLVNAAPVSSSDVDAMTNEQKNVDDFNDEYVEEEEENSIDSQISDPFEDVNRVIFDFNDGVDRYLLEPIAKKYYSYIPDIIQDGVTNFFENLRYPQYVISDIIQFKFSQLLTHTGRFITNSTIGIVGFVDVAQDLGLQKHYEDLGTALAYHGVGHGPYLVIPFLGPKSTKDLLGYVGDQAVHPYSLIEYSDDMHSGETDRIRYFGTATNVVSTRASLLKAIEAAKESSFDYYLFIRSAYYQDRLGVLNDNQQSNKIFEPE